MTRKWQLVIASTVKEEGEEKEAKEGKVKKRQEVNKIFTYNFIINPKYVIK